MTYLYAFLFSGTICVLGELVYKFTKLTPGHITSILVVIGSILEGFGIYEPLKEVFKGGISSLIINFGALITKGFNEMYDNKGIFFIFNGGFYYTSAVISFTIFYSVILSFLPKWKTK